MSVWAQVGITPGHLLWEGALAVQRVSTGTYQVTITAPACAQSANAPVISVSDPSHLAGQAAGALPVAWSGRWRFNQQFMVFTRVVAGGSFTSTDTTPSP